MPGRHHVARELQRLGHDVRLIPSQYVRPFVKTNRNDAAYEGICEAVVRPNMRFVSIKSIKQPDISVFSRPFRKPIIAVWSRKSPSFAPVSRH